MPLGELRRRSPYAPVSSTLIPTPKNYALAPTALIVSVPNTPNAYPYPSSAAFLPLASGEYTSTSSTSTIVPVAYLEISTPSQGAIIAISVICGLLLIALLFAILVMVGKRHEREQLRLTVAGGGGGSGHHRTRRSEKSYTEDEDVDRLRAIGLGDIGRRPMYPVFSRGQEMGMGGAGKPMGVGVDPRQQSLGGGLMGKEREERDVGEVEDSEVSSTRVAGGTKTSRSGSETGHHSSKGSRTNSKRHHRGQLGRKLAVTR